jgi:hypothetical protein
MKKNKLDLLHLVGILFIKPRCTETRNSKTAQHVSGRPARPRPRPTALLSPSPDGKPEAATAVVAAPDDEHEDARNMLSCV